MPKGGRRTRSNEGDEFEDAQQREEPELGRVTLSHTQLQAIIGQAAENAAAKAAATATDAVEAKFAELPIVP